MKKIMTIVAALALMLVGMTTLAAPAQATGSDTCTPQAAYTEYTGWVLASPGEGWYQVDERTVVDTPAHQETHVVTEAQHYSLKGNSGLGKDEVPPTPAENPDIWQANTHKEPHLNNANITWYDDPVNHTGRHYASHGSKGKRDWFYFQPEVTETVDVPAVTHEEYKFAYDHPAVTCEGPTDVCLNIDDVQTEVPEGMLETADGNCYAPVLPTVTPPTCDKDGALVKNDQPEGIYDFYSPEGTGPGTYTVQFSNVNVKPLSQDGRETFVFEVLPATGDCPVPPKHHTTVTQKHTETPAAVPTVIESGLAGTQTAPDDENNAGWLVALAVGILLLGAAALRRKN